MREENVGGGQTAGNGEHVGPSTVGWTSGSCAAARFAYERDENPRLKLTMHRFGIFLSKNTFTWCLRRRIRAQVVQGASV